MVKLLDSYLNKVKSIRIIYYIYMSFSILEDIVLIMNLDFILELLQVIEKIIMVMNLIHFHLQVLYEFIIYFILMVLK